jgi:hypothetical protein
MEKEPSEEVFVIPEVVTEERRQFSKCTRA